MGAYDLSDKYALSPRACSPRACSPRGLGIHIRQVPCAHVTTIICNMGRRDGYMLRDITVVSVGLMLRTYKHTMTTVAMELFVYSVNV